MGCLVFFNFLLLATAVTLLILGVTTTRWLVFTETNNINLRTERSIGIIYACQRLYYQNVTDLYSTISNFSSNSAYDDAYVCYNRLFKWYNASISGPELLGKGEKPRKCVLICPQSSRSQMKIQTE